MTNPVGQPLRECSAPEITEVAGFEVVSILEATTTPEQFDQIRALYGQRYQLNQEGRCAWTALQSACYLLPILSDAG